MSWIFVDKDNEGGGGQMRHEMRRNMRGGYRNIGGSSAMMRGEGWEHGYRMGYRHGWEDSEDDMDDMQMRRGRDSRGRYI